MVGSIAAIRFYAQQGLSTIQNFKATLPFIAIGSILGATLLTSLAQSDILNTIIPYILITISLYSLIPQAYFNKLNLSSLKGITKIIIWSGIGAYGGAISMATGPILIAIHRIINRSALSLAIAETKIMMFTINLTSLTILIMSGHLWWKMGVLLALGNILGAWIGTKTVTGKFTIISRVIVFIVPMVIAMNLLIE